ncbi:hypothetical protein GOARA_064_00680 [Gordonia araii NBRC 100433]|uniref:Transmembrane protein n=2 Tax=Gordonia araii TaxID=263909 RepID=G7H5E1_9ACTN|nr:hypothetical protein GOARA_064_00680 [Gordonia araii NBRC 100433]
MLRGLLMGAVVTVGWVLVGALMGVTPTIGTAWKVIALAIIVLTAIIWGGYDGIRDARANPDPDDYADLTMVWLKAGFLAAFIAVVVGWVVGTLFVPGMGVSSIFIALTAGISSLTLFVYVPAFAGVAIGRWLVRREDRKGAQTADNLDLPAQSAAATAE